MATGLCAGWVSRGRRRPSSRCKAFSTSSARPIAAAARLRAATLSQNCQGWPKLRAAAISRSNTSGVTSPAQRNPPKPGIWSKVTSSEKPSCGSARTNRPWLETWIGFSTRIRRRRAGWNSVPTSRRSAHQRRALPSKIGISWPSTSATALSIPSAARLAIRCSIVRNLRALPRSSAVQSGLGSR